MAYNRRNLLNRIIDVQEITLREKEHGSSQVWIYQNIIADRFRISKSTYDRYLAIAAKREIKKLINNN
jgi:hypothetical protein